MIENRLKKQILVIDPGTRVPELDTFNNISLLSNVPCTYHLPALFGFSSLKKTKGKMAGVVVLGSGASVYDALDWQDTLKEWLLEPMALGVPILGICYGHQLLAHMAGGKVGLVEESGKKFVGVREVEMEPGALWGAPVKQTYVVSHREEVKNCPSDYNVIGKSSLVACEILAHKRKPIWTIQGHPEATEEFLENQSIEIEESRKKKAFQDGRSLITHFLNYSTSILS